MSDTLVKPAVSVTAAAKPESPVVDPSLTLYVGDLRPEITREEILKIFSKIGEISEVSIRKNKRSRFAYSYVTYSTPEQATTALKEFNHFVIDGRPCRVMRASPGKLPVGPSEANVYVKNLPKSLGPEAFYKTFAAFGEILSSKLAFDDKKISKGYGFVQYATPEQAKTAITKTNGSKLEVEGSDKPLIVSIFSKKNKKRPSRRGFKNVFFKNLPLDGTLESFTTQWSRFGKITSAFLHTGQDGKPTGTGFANFEKTKASAAVVKATRNNGPDEVKALRALSKTERKAHQGRKVNKAVKRSA
ncbi:hypothetical protein O181_023849 [Austropuccinia psidii MF-1]|uniref:RRM domain-containing protein n=1 Tax=Austropuccinia psidii MF-1 TaxID=1389203 RepID=A0A9Q3GZ31_9BASI|nr:hypothetical protein [Austropuccinia psidii MF-1]